MFSETAHSQNPPTDPQTGHEFYDMTLKSIRGEDVSLSDFKGQVLLIVNTASKCGFTSQYEGLEEIYTRYKDKGFSVLGFPSNDFGKQEPGDNEEIVKFCKLRYGVSFPLFEKGKVVGDDKQAIYKYLEQNSPTQFQGRVKWNFTKFLIDSNGQVVGRFGSFTKPTSSKITKQIEKMLDKS